MLTESVATADKILRAAEKSKKKIMYAENWVYSPAVQKEVEIMHSTKGQILWMIGDESHSGSHSESYGIWSQSGGGSLIGKACHPLTAMLYLKRVEGMLRDARPIRATSVSANVHEITRQPSFRDEGYLRTNYNDVEDYSQVHLTFSDGTVADVFASELVLGGVNSWIDIFANNHRTRCNLNPVEAVKAYNPKEELFDKVYVIEKIGTKQGWNSPALDENWLNGYYQEIQDFVECLAYDREPLSGGDLGKETVEIIYGAYLSTELDGHRVQLSI